MGKVSDASSIYLGTVAADKLYLGATEIWAPSSGSDPAYGTGVYGPPLDFTTPGAPGPFIISNSRKRVSVVYAQIEDLSFSPIPYRIDWDVTSANGATLKVDWCDVSPGFQQVVVAGNHYSHESEGRIGGYSTTYRFIDFECLEAGASVTIDNIMVRRIFEFSS